MTARISCSQWLGVQTTPDDVLFFVRSISRENHITYNDFMEVLCPPDEAESLLLLEGGGAPKPSKPRPHKASQPIELGSSSSPSDDDEEDDEDDEEEDDEEEYEEDEEDDEEEEEDDDEEEDEAEEDEAEH